MPKIDEWNIPHGWHFAAMLVDGENTDALRNIHMMIYALDRTHCEEQQFSGPAEVVVDEDGKIGWVMMGIGRPRLPGGLDTATTAML